MSDENKTSDIKVSGEGYAANPDESSNPSNLMDAVEYDPSQDDTKEDDGSDNSDWDYNPGDNNGLNEDEVMAVQKSIEIDVDPESISNKDLDENGYKMEKNSKNSQTKEDSNNITKESILDESKLKEDPTPSDCGKSDFNDTEVQNILKPTKGKEGGVVKNKTTGPTMSTTPDNKNIKNKDAEMTKPPPDMDSDSIIGKYEVTGFSVDYEINGDTRSVDIRDYFNDLETAFASVNGDKYLMPMVPDGYKVSTIRSGAPRISYNERELYLYREDEWARV